MIIQKKGQGAIEYLQTYGWAILVIIIVGVALWQLGIFSPGGKGINRASGFTKIKVLDPSIKYYANIVPDPVTNDSNPLNFTIVNGAGDMIRIDYIMIKGDCNNTAYPKEATGYAYLDPGSTMIVEAHNCTTLVGNEQFYVELNISYSQKLGRERIYHYDSGIIQGVAD